MEKLNQKEYSIIGRSVVNFTETEQCLASVGEHVDALMSAQDSPSCLECCSSLYLCLTSLQKSVNDFVLETLDYIDSCRKVDNEEK